MRCTKLGGLGRVSWVPHSAFLWRGGAFPIALDPGETPENGLTYNIRYNAFYEDKIAQDRERVRSAAAEEGHRQPAAVGGRRAGADRKRSGHRTVAVRSRLCGPGGGVPADGGAA